MRATVWLVPIADIAKLARLIRDTQPCVVLTGAGVSTETSRKNRCLVDGECDH